MCGCCPPVGDLPELPHLGATFYRPKTVLFKIFGVKKPVKTGDKHQTATLSGRGGQTKHLTRMFDQFNAEDEAR